MKNLIAFMSLNLFLLLFSSAVLNAQSRYWQMTLCSGKKLTHFSFGDLSEDSLCIHFSEKSAKVAIDSIKEIRCVRKSQLLKGIAIGTVAGTLLGVVLAPKNEPEQPAPKNPLEEELNEVSASLSTIGPIAFGMVLGFVTGAVIGGAMGKDDVYDFSQRTLSEKRSDIALIIKREKYHKKRKRKE